MTNIVANAARTALQTIASTPEAAQTASVASTVEATNSWAATITGWIDHVYSYVWGAPLIGGILITGLLLTCMLRMHHVLNLKKGFRYMFQQSGSSGEVSQFASRT